MAFLEKVVPLNTTDTTVYECPVTLAGSVHGLVFSNVSAVAANLTVKLFSQATGQLTTILSTFPLDADVQFTWPKPINIVAGDKIVAFGSINAAIVAIASVYTNVATPASAGFVARGEWTTIATYVANDIVTYGGVTYFATTGSLNSAPPSVNWIKLADRGVSISGVALNGSKHLIVSYTEGTSTDLGAFLSITSAALNSSKHLIVTYSDATTADLGAILGVSSVAFNGAKHLILTYTDGSTTDLGLLLGLTSMSLDASKNLIATYTDGSTANLGLVRGISGVALDASKHLIITYSDGNTTDLGLQLVIASVAFDGNNHLIITYNNGTTSDAGYVKSISSTAIVGNELVITYSNGTTQNVGQVAGYTHPANHAPSIITQDSSNRFVTDTEKATWNAKQEALVSGTNLRTVNGNDLQGSGDIILVGGLIATPIKTSAYTAVINDLVRVNSTSGAFTVTLPSDPSDGDKVGVFDVSNTCQTNAVLLAAAGGRTVEGDSTGLSINVRGAYVYLIYNSTGTNWKIGLFSTLPGAS